MGNRADNNDERYHKQREHKEAIKKQSPTGDEESLPPPVETIRSSETKPKRKKKDR